MRTLPVLVLGLAACGGNPQKQLDDARASWVENGSEAYDMTVTRTQLGPGADSYRIQVVAGGVRSAIQTTGGANAQLEASEYLPWFTVVGVFDAIQEGIDAGAFEVNATYDPDAGYPVSVTIDMEQLAADDDVTYDITDMILNASG